MKLPRIQSHWRDLCFLDGPSPTWPRWSALSFFAHGHLKHFSLSLYSSRVLSLFVFLFCFFSFVLSLSVCIRLFLSSYFSFFFFYLFTHSFFFFYSLTRFFFFLIVPSFLFFPFIHSLISFILSPVTIPPFVLYSLFFFSITSSHFFPYYFSIIVYLTFFIIFRFSVKFHALKKKFISDFKVVMCEKLLFVSLNVVTRI